MKISNGVNHKKIIFVVSFLVVSGFLFNLNAPTAKAITAEEILILIQQLQQQIAVLQQQLTQIQEKPAVWCHTFNTNLSIGNPAGIEVDALRTALTKEGFTNVSTELGDNQLAGFDEKLASAVSAFQQKYRSEILDPLGLPSGTGYVGPSTRAKLNALYGCVVTQQPIATQPSVVPLGPYFWSGTIAGYSGDALMSKGLSLAKDLGAKAIRITMSPRSDVDYVDGACIPNFTLEGLAQRSDFRAILSDSQFSTVLITAYDGVSWGDCNTKNYLNPDFYTAENTAKIEKEYADLASYLKQFSGKRFIVLNWEGDHDTQGIVQNLDGYKKWFTARYNGIRSSGAGNVLSGIEFNFVNLASIGGGKILYDVIPFVNSDYYSYSSYESINISPDQLALDIDTIKSVLSGAGKNSNNLIIGEFGFRVGDFGNAAATADKLKKVAEVIKRKNLPYGIVWALLDSPSGFGMYDADGNITESGKAIKEVIGVAVVQPSPTSPSAALNLTVRGSPGCTTGTPSCNYNLGDSFVLTFTSNQPNTSFKLCSTQTNNPYGYNHTNRCAYPTTTKSDGSFSWTGTWGSNDNTLLGTWKEWVEIGTYKSPTITFTVSPAPTVTPSITVSYPTAGETLTKGSATFINLQFSPSVPKGGFVINLLRSDTNVTVAHLKYCGITGYTQDSAMPMNVSWKWKVGYAADDREIPNGSYRIFVYDCGDKTDLVWTGSIASAKSGVFNIVSPTIQPSIPYISSIYPTSGSAGSIITIYGRNLKDTMPSAIRVELMQNGEVKGIIYASSISTQPDGLAMNFKLEPLVVANIQLGTYQVRVVNDNGYSNTINFTVVAVTTTPSASLNLSVNGLSVNCATGSTVCSFKQGDSYTLKMTSNQYGQPFLLCSTLTGNPYGYNHTNRCTSTLYTGSSDGAYTWSGSWSTTDNSLIGAWTEWVTFPNTAGGYDSPKITFTIAQAPAPASASLNLSVNGLSVNCATGSTVCSFKQGDSYTLKMTSNQYGQPFLLCSTLTGNPYGYNHTNRCTSTLYTGSSDGAYTWSGSWSTTDNSLIGTWTEWVQFPNTPGVYTSPSITFTITATTAAAPTASLTVITPLVPWQQSGSVTVYPGTTIIYYWSAINADSANSSYTVSPAYTSTKNCGGFIGAGPFSWVANTLSGSISATVQDCQVGYTYIINFIATKGDQSTPATLKVIVPSPLGLKNIENQLASLSQAISLLMENIKKLIENK